MVNTYKVVLCGKTGVGKTSIFQRMCGSKGTLKSGKAVQKTMMNHERQVIVKIDDSDDTVQFNLWDTVGLEEYAQLTRSQFLLSQAVLFVYSADDRDSLSQVADLLQFAKINAQGACFILITNKIDITETVSADDISECFPNNPFTLTFRTSALTGDGIQEMVQSVARHLFRKATPMKSIGRRTPRGGGASFNNSSTHCNNGSLEVIQLNIEEKQVPRRKKKCCHH